MSNGTKPIPVKIASREELMTLPPGLYELPGVTSKKDIYDVFSDRFFDADTVELARVMEAGSELPRGVDITVRPDGRCIVTQFHLIQGTETNIRPWSGHEPIQL